MPVNNLVYALASPNRIGDTSWINLSEILQTFPDMLQDQIPVELIWFYRSPL